MDTFAEKRKNAPKLGVASNKASVADKRETTCSDCKFGIFVGQERKWTSSGLVHPDCSNPWGSSEDKLIT